MAKSERVCRIGSMTLAPIALGAVAAIAGGLIYGIVVFLESLNIPPIPEGSKWPLVVPLGMMVVMAITVCIHAVYPWLYRHCRGAQFMADFEAIERDEEVINKAYYKQQAEIMERKRLLMLSQRKSPA